MNNEDRKLNTLTISYEAANEGDSAAVRINNEDPHVLLPGGAVTVPVPVGAVVIVQEKLADAVDAEQAAIDAEQAAAHEAAAKAQAEADAEAARQADIAKAQAEADAKAAEEQRLADEAKAAENARIAADAEAAEAETIANGPEATDEHEDGEVYEIEGVKYLCGMFGNEEDGSDLQKGLMPLEYAPAEVLAELATEGKITDEEARAIIGKQDEIAAAKAAEAKAEGETAATPAKGKRSAKA